jgi:hypothetical protein
MPTEMHHDRKKVCSIQGITRYLQQIKPRFVVELFLHHYCQPMGAQLLLYRRKEKKKDYNSYAASYSFKN